MKLTEFAINKKGMIIEILENAISTKLVEFGILPGVQFQIVNKASFNGPIFITIGSNRIALRQSEAASIIVE